MKLDTTFLALVRAPQHRFDISKHSAAAAAVHPNSTHSLIYLELERVANGAEKKKQQRKKLEEMNFGSSINFRHMVGRIPFNHTVQRVELCVIFFLHKLFAVTREVLTIDSQFVLSFFALRQHRYITLVTSHEIVMHSICCYSAQTSPSWLGIRLSTTRTLCVTMWRWRS